MVFESDKLILSKSGNFVGKGYSCDGMIKLYTNDNFNNWLLILFICVTQIPYFCGIIGLDMLV